MMGVGALAMSDVSSSIKVLSIEDRKRIGMFLLGVQVPCDAVSKG